MVLDALGGGKPRGFIKMLINFLFTYLTKGKSFRDFATFLDYMGECKAGKNECESQFD